MPLTGAAAARLYDDHVDAVHAMVTRRLGTKLGATVTSEVFEQAVKSWDRFDSEQNTERLFLLGIATVVLRRHRDAEHDHLTSLRPVERSGGVVRDPLVTVIGPDGELVKPGGDDPADDVALTMRAVVDLDPDDRDILLLSLWEGCPHADVGGALDLAVGTVRSSLGRIRRELKKSVAASKSKAPSRRRKPTDDAPVAGKSADEVESNAPATDAGEDDADATEASSDGAGTGDVEEATR